MIDPEGIKAIVSALLTVLQVPQLFNLGRAIVLRLTKRKSK